LVPIGSAGHDGGGGGLPTAASPQPDIFASAKLSAIVDV
jgi:hypothetical protein